MNAAVSLFKRKGYDNVSINEICKEAGVGRSSFYAVFPSKREILNHLLALEKQDLKGVLQDFLSAKNDFERMWSLCERFLLLAERLGPALTGAMLSMELNESLGIYDNMDSVNEWLVALMRNGQASGVIRCANAPEIMVPIVSGQVFQVIFNWCRCRGAFPLQEKARFCAETLYDVAPECRIT